MSGLGSAGAWTIAGLVVFVFVAAAAIVLLLIKESEHKPGQFSHPTYTEPDEPGDEQPLAAQVEAWLAREDFR